MAKILEFLPRDVENNARSMRDIRTEHGLSLNQAARALDVSPSTLEKWEGKSALALDPTMVTNKYTSYLSREGDEDGKNLLFNQLPLRLSREILGLGIEEIARDYGYKKQTWLKFESNRRPLSREVLREIERRVRLHFSSLCEDI